MLRFFLNRMLLFMLKLLLPIQWSLLLLLLLLLSLLVLLLMLSLLLLREMTKGRGSRETEPLGPPLSCFALVMAHPMFTPSPKRGVVTPTQLLGLSSAEESAMISSLSTSPCTLTSLSVTVTLGNRTTPSARSPSNLSFSQSASPTSIPHNQESLRAMPIGAPSFTPTPVSRTAVPASRLGHLLASGDQTINTRATASITNVLPSAQEAQPRPIIISSRVALRHHFNCSPTVSWTRSSPRSRSPKQWIHPLPSRPVRCRAELNRSVSPVCQTSLLRRLEQSDSLDSAFSGTSPLARGSITSRIHRSTSSSEHEPAHVVVCPGSDGNSALPVTASSPLATSAGAITIADTPLHHQMCVVALVAFKRLCTLQNLSRGDLAVHPPRATDDLLDLCCITEAAVLGDVLHALFDVYDAMDVRSLSGQVDPSDLELWDQWVTEQHGQWVCRKTMQSS
jgi:hypothetical protein